MARPKKQEVDYFPHYCDHGKVLFVIEDRWGNDGYAAFYRLMELLGKTNSHCYDCHEPENWEYLIATIRVSEDVATDILDKLASMRVIDPALWKERRIWMQSFVDSIADVYARRKVDLPTKPCTSTEFMPTETPLNGINDDSNPQSKVKESKVKESKESGVIPGWVPKETFFEYQESRKKKLKPVAFKRFFEKLRKLSTGTTPEKILAQSIENGWEGIFELKIGGQNGRATTTFRNEKRPAVYAEQEREADAINAKYFGNQTFEAAD